MKNIVETNIMQNLADLLDKYGITVYSVADGGTKLVTGDMQVGYISCITSTASGMKSYVVHVDGMTNGIAVEDGPDLPVDIEYLDKMLAEHFEEVGKKSITVQYLNDQVNRLSVNAKGDWIDLYAAETVDMKQGEHKLIHLGVAMKLPEGYEAHLVPRSSTYKKWGIIQANHVGIIDNSYSGPNDWWMLSAIAMRDTTIHAGDKICQFRIVERQPPIKFVEGKMEGEDRGGFGSTGTK